MSKKVRSTKPAKQRNNNAFKLNEIQPITDNQKKAFDEYDNGNNLILSGVAGTGKTFVSLYLALDEILNKKSPYNKVVLIRSVVPSRDMGFLPGTIQEKTKIFEDPYKVICDDLFGRGDGYDILRLKGMIDFTTTSFLRGMTFTNSIVILDEIQNCTFQEIDTIVTRIGHNCRFIACGDIRQTDLTKRDDKSGLLTFFNISDKMPSFRKIEFNAQDIVRSGFVKEYIIAKLNHGIV